MRQSTIVSTVAAAATALLLFMSISGGSFTPLSLALSTSFALLGAVLTFTILRRGKVNHVRLSIFILSGIAFTIALSLEHQVNRGSILLSDQALNTVGAPMCAIAIPYVLVPYVLLHELIFSTTEAKFFSILLPWLAMVLILGRGWCSWICFFGWMDQFFSSLLKKPVIKIENPPKAARLFPYALMLFLILVGLVTQHTIFCTYICPLRIIYDPPAVNTTFEWILALIFVTGGLVFLVIGPLLTKKRIFCSYICPLMPLNSIIGQVSPFKVRIDKSRCKDCGLCLKSCELGAITKESLANGGTTLECAKCGRCIDSCPAHAIDYKLISTEENITPWFIVLAVVFCLLMTQLFIGSIIEYIMTGHIRGF